MMGKIEKWTMKQDGICRPCGLRLLKGTVAIKTAAHGGQDKTVYICMDCGRSIAKVVLATADLDEFGQEMVMDKLSDVA
jgi:DNA-directed RNA polymerase subunit RPC12/RpoP